MGWYIEVLKKYAVFSGRARRKEYWMFALFNTIVVAILYGVFFMLETMIPIIIYDLAILLPSLGVSIRRMHDLNKSGFWILISLIPFIGSIWFLVLTCLEGTRGDNRFGPDPKGAEYIDMV